jgi:hypothetical protein
MSNEPQDRRADVSVQQVRPGEGPGLTTPEEVGEPGRKWTVADTEWLSMAPGPFPQRPGLEVKTHTEPAGSMTVIPAQAEIPCRRRSVTPGPVNPISMTS